VLMCPALSLCSGAVLLVLCWQGVPEAIMCLSVGHCK
jgi:hypothetical protein